MVRIKRKEVRLANRGALKKGFAGAQVWREGVLPTDEAGLTPPPPPKADAPHHHSGACFAASLCKNTPGFTAMGCPGVLGPPEGTTLPAAVPAGAARSGVVVLHQGRSPGSGNAVTLRGCLGAATAGLCFGWLF